ncbi:MAG: flavin reductase [Bacteroides sp.]|nr:flavin reductase [Roseburia sp.]MCM1345636.1 flavin reductase [Bacteroides sp.]MCM1420940.1 flavin reductase [Bacteroides sp.]
MKEIKASEIKENIVGLIKNDWMLITAGTADDFNTMTANWGLMGELWFENMVEVVVRQQRYTKSFVEREGRFTLTFFGPEYKKVLSVMGTKSGREIDKMHYPGLDADVLPSGMVTFKGAKLIIECETVYSDILDEANFKDKSVYEKCYGKIAGGIHTRYYGRILRVWSAE